MLFWLAFLNFDGINKLLYRVSNSEAVILKNNGQQINANDPADYLAVYTLFPQEMNLTILEKYTNASNEVNFWALIEYYIQELYQFEIIDSNKETIYIGWYSELFWDYHIEVNKTKSYYYRYPDSSSRVAYNFTNETSIFIPSLRLWFDKSTQGSSLTTFVSTYVFAGSGNIGATLSMAFDNSTMNPLGAMSYDILPYSAAADKNTLINKLFLDPQSTDDFQYIMIDEEKVQAGNYDYDAISSDLAVMVYSNDNDTVEQEAANLQQIRSTLKVESFTDITDNKISYFSYVFDNEKKYLFFSDIELMRSRSDDFTVRENVNKVGFTGNAASLDRELQEIINDLTVRLVIFNVIFSIVICIIALLMTILASRLLVDSIMNNIIQMCIKIKIAQTSQVKIRRRQELSKELEMTVSFYSRDGEQIQNNKNEMYQLFKVIEDVLKIFMIKNFELKESNSQDYNNAALYEYTELLDIYNETYDRIINDEMISEKQKDILIVKSKETKRKIYNNMGWIWYSLGEYHEANNNFMKSCEKETNLEIAYFDQVYSTPEKKELTIKEKAGRTLNYAKMMIKKISDDYDMSPVQNNNEIEMYKFTEMKLEQCHNKISSPGIVNEVEILSLILSIRIKLKLEKIEAWEKELRMLSRIIGYKAEMSNNERLWDVLNQYYSFYKSKIEIERLKRLRLSENEHDQNLSPYSSPVKKRRASIEFTFENEADLSTKRLESINDFRITESKFIKSIWKSLLQVIYVSKYADPELFTAWMKTLDEFIKENENKFLNFIGKFHFRLILLFPLYIVFNKL